MLGMIYFPSALMIGGFFVSLAFEFDVGPLKKWLVIFLLGSIGDMPVEK